MIFNHGREFVKKSDGINCYHTTHHISFFQTSVGWKKNPKSWTELYLCKCCTSIRQMQTSDLVSISSDQGFLVITLQRKSPAVKCWSWVEVSQNPCCRASALGFQLQTWTRIWPLKEFGRIFFLCVFWGYVPLPATTTAVTIGLYLMVSLTTSCIFHITVRNIFSIERKSFLLFQLLLK